MPSINWIAVLAASISGFVLGGLWYSPILLGKQWQREAKLTDEQLKAGSPAVIFGGAFVLSFLASLAFAFFLGPEATLGQGALYGLAAGLFWVTAAFGVNYLFERRSIGLFLINGGYNTLWFLVIGVVIASLS
jgi:hypothetical protein